MNKLYALILLFQIYLLTGCSPEAFSNSDAFKTLPTLNDVIGGTFVPTSSPIATTTVGLYDSQYNFTCTATLLAENVALTAAHCIEAEGKNLQVIFASELSAVIGSEDAAVQSDSLRHVTRAVVHSQWIKDNTALNNWHDLALVKFSGPLPKGYKPATWLPTELTLALNDQVVVAGYGATSVKTTNINEKKFPNLEKAIADGEVTCDETLPDEKRHCYKVDFLGDDDLKMTAAKIKSLLPSEITLDESHGHGTCVGDSGGPAFVEKNGIYYFFGVTSRGSTACDGIGVYTNVLYFKSWIAETIQQLN